MSPDPVDTEEEEGYGQNEGVVKVIRSLPPAESQQSHSSSHLF
jgi:hypothetical protein